MHGAIGSRQHHVNLCSSFLVSIGFLDGPVQLEQVFHDFVNNNQAGNSGLGEITLRADLKVLVDALVDVGLVRLEVVSEFPQ